MVVSVSQILNYLKAISSIKNGIHTLSESDFFARDISVQNIIENYFTCEELPTKKISVIGKLSNYALNADFPIYTPRDMKVEGNGVVNKIVDGQLRPQLGFKTQALNVPASTFNNITLDDGSKAKVLWLFPQETHGLRFDLTKEKVGLDVNQLDHLFTINDNQKPILILADIDWDFTHYTFRTVKLIGKITTAPLSSFENISNNTSLFTRNFYINCFRQFTESTGLLGIDIRKPNGNVKILDKKKSPFHITYTVQGMINCNNALSDEFKSKCALGIPDRQGLPEQITFIGDQTTEIQSILTINDISWQYLQNSQSYGAFIGINLADPVDVSSKFAKLSHHWNLWQKKAPEIISNRFKESIDINTTFCSNSLHEKRFDSNGFVIPKNIEKALLNKDPNIRESIDWLGISVGKT